MIRILIADDHALFRAGLRRVLEEAGDMEVVAEAADGHQALELAPRHGPDVVLLDISMPGRASLEAVEELRKRVPRARVLILTAQPEDHQAVRYLQAGAAGYIVKAVPAQDLLAAVRKVHGGGRYVSSTLAERIAFGLGPDPQIRPHERLSPREYQVMLLIGKGKTATHIADELCLSVKTISTYRSRILDKMDMRNNAEIIRYVVREGITG